jgi:hypothetical protein
MGWRITLYGPEVTSLASLLTSGVTLKLSSRMDTTAQKPKNNPKAETINAHRSQCSVGICISSSTINKNCNHTRINDLYLEFIFGFIFIS